MIFWWFLLPMEICKSKTEKAFYQFWWNCQLCTAPLNARLPFVLSLQIQNASEGVASVSVLFLLLTNGDFRANAKSGGTQNNNLGFEIIMREAALWLCDPHQRVRPKMSRCKGGNCLEERSIGKEMLAGVICHGGGEKLHLLKFTLLHREGAVFSFASDHPCQICKMHRSY